MNPGSSLYAGVNAVGWLLYVGVVHSIQHTMHVEQRNYAEFGDSLDFLTTGLPILVVCFLWNCAFGIAGLLLALARQYELIFLWVVSAVGWVATIFLLPRLT